MKTKPSYVLNQKQTRKHECHWPGCTQQVPPAMWGCKNHWFQLPAELRAMVWAAYKHGQEIKGIPTKSYLKVVELVQVWIIAVEYSRSQVAVDHPL